MKPINESVVVLQTKTVDELKSAGGIVLTKEVEIPTAEGKVIALSEDLKETIAVGDTVVYGKHCGILIQHPDHPDAVVKLIYKKDLLVVR